MCATKTGSRPIRILFTACRSDSGTEAITDFVYRTIGCSWAIVDEEELTDQISLAFPDAVVASACARERALHVVHDAGLDIPVLVVGDPGDRHLSDDSRLTEVIAADDLERLPLAILRAVSEHALRRLREAGDQLIRLRSVEEQLDSALRVTNQAFWQREGTGDRIRVSDTLPRMFGYLPAPGSLPLQWFRERIHPDDVANVEQEIDDSIRSGRSTFCVEYRWRRADGTYADVEDYGHVLRNGDDQVVQVSGVMRDKSEENAMHRALRGSELRFRAITDNAHDAILLVDDDLKIVFWNRAAERMFGYSRLDAVGRDVRTIVDPKWQGEAERQLREMFADEGTLQGRTGRLNGRSSDGRTFPIEASVSRSDIDGSRTVTAAVRDVTVQVGLLRRWRRGVSLLQTVSEAGTVNDALRRLVPILAKDLALAAAAWIVEGSSSVLVAEQPAPDMLRFDGGEPEARRNAVAAVINGSPREIDWRRGETILIPLGAGQRVVAVLELRARDLDLPSEVIEELTALAGQLGQPLARLQSDQDRQYRMDRESVFASIAARLASISEGEFDDGIDYALAELGRFSEGDRAYLFRLHDHDLMSNTHEWTAEGVSAEISNMQKLRVLDFPLAIERLRTDGYLSIEDVQGLQAPAEREALTAQGIRSLLAVAQKNGTELAGFVGIDFVRSQRTFSRDEIALVSMVADLLSSTCERHTASERLRRSEWRLKQAERLAHVTSWEYDIATATAQWSEEINRITGTPAARHPLAVTEFFQNFVAAEDRPLVEEQWARLLEHGHPFDGEFRLRRPDGEFRVVHAHASRTADPEQERPTIVGSLQDVTEKRMLQRQLEAASRLAGLGSVASHVAHQFNNVLMGIQPAAELVRRSEDPTLHSAAAQIIRAVQRGKRISEGILQVTQRPPLHVAPAGVRQWMVEMAAEAEKITGQHIAVDITIEDDPLTVLLDRSQIDRVLLNLLLNARDAMDGRGAVRMVARQAESRTIHPFGVVDRPETKAHIVVTDSGHGMTEEVMARMFEPLFTTRAGSAGLGLVGAQDIVARHGGELFAESTPDVGTSMHIFLPLVTTSAGDPQTKHGGDPPSAMPSPQKLLLVEDDEDVGAGLVLLLELEGFTVAWVRQGKDAAPAAERLDPDAIVLDIGLPDMSGLEVCRQLEQIRPSLAVVFSTGHGEQDVLSEYAGRTDVTCLVKPYDLDALLAAIRRVIAGRDGAAFQQ